jgi:hypothetical protein
VKWRRVNGRYYYGDDKVDHAYIDKRDYAPAPWDATIYGRPRPDLFRTLAEAKAWVERTLRPRRRRR